jgi:hypothetical protein
MLSRPFPSPRPMIEIAMSTDTEPDKSLLRAPPTLLRGAETLDLYLGVIRRNMKTLDPELDLLRRPRREGRIAALD